MDLGITGKRALVLGSSRGLGHGIASAIAAEGAEVVIVGRDAEKLGRAAEVITALGGGTAHPVAVDMSGPEALDRLMDGVSAAVGSVDILVNNNGGPPPGPITAVSPEDWRRQFEAMVLTLIELTGRVLPGMRERNWGRILTIASTSVVQPIPNLGISNTLRASVVTWGKTLSLEVAPYGITVNTILPGRIQTQRVDELDAAAARKQGRPVEDIARDANAAIPLGRYGRVDEFAAVAAFLVSERASYITGTMIRVDGGAIRSI
jgi:3-oxoacyl-[acyl-carrier protein] reductase